MGLTRERAAESAKRPDADYAVALAGSPNVGKSTVFNALTGLHRHTGNWTGKTVSLAYGLVECGDARVALVDLPGSVSLCPESPEEKVSADFLTSGEADAAIIVCDALALERNLIFVLAAAGRVKNCVLCVNMIDEAKRAGVRVDAAALAEMTGLPVVLCSARRGEGVDELIPAALGRIKKAANTDGSEGANRPANAGDPTSPAPESADVAPASDPADPAALAARAREIAHRCTSGAPRVSRASRAADRILTGRVTGPISMILLLAVVFWITAVGANAPSDGLAALFGWFEGVLRRALTAISLPPSVVSCLVDGVYRVSAWVVSVMLPPMAIFFPLFTLAEDVGLFPRVAFDLDRSFARCKSCGRHAITSVMGLGCNAVGVCGCRIISSPRRRRAAILTNSFIPCNGRIGAIFLVTSTFLARTALGESAVVVAVFAFALGAAFAASALLGLRARADGDEPFILEMVRFRRPQIAKTLVRSFLDRTLFVLGRAVAVAAPAGLLIWLASNVTVAGATPVDHIASALDGAGRALGVDGTVLCAFIFGLPANEIVLPLAAAIYSHGSLSSSTDLASALASAGWTAQTAVSFLALTVLHSPCATTLLTIRRETGSLRTTIAAALLPTAFGVAACLLIRAVFALFA